MDSHVRRAAQQDVPALCDLYLEFHEFHATRIPARLQSLRVTGRFARKELARKLLRLLEDQETLLLIVEREGGIAGLAELYLREDDRENRAVVSRRYAYLQTLVVTAAARRQELGRQPLNAAEKWADENGAEEVRLDVWEFAAGPLPFYERAGYRTLKRTLVRRLDSAADQPG